MKAAIVPKINRLTTKHTKLGRQEIQAGERIGAFIGSGNHDESVFTDPEHFDITRGDMIVIYAKKAKIL